MKFSKVVLIGAFLLAIFLLAQRAAPTLQARPRVEAGLREAIALEGQGSYLVFMQEQADLSAADNIVDWEARGQFVYETLWLTAQDSQSALVTELNGRRMAGVAVAYQSYYIFNGLAVTSDLATLDALAARDDVALIAIDRPMAFPELVTTTSAPEATEWGLDMIRAPEIWADFGVRGEGVIVGMVDSGAQYDHPALVDQYRGNLGSGTFDHDYNFYDVLGKCNGGAPCDGFGHGTHTTGTVIGDDGGSNQIGVAPGATWIMAKPCEFNCTESTFLTGLEWMLAPYPQSGTPGDGDPSKRPHVGNNSWGVGQANLFFAAAIQAWRAADILPVVSAGNSGPGASTLGSPGDYAESFTIGATDVNDVIASFSSRGPSPLTAETKPDVSAPGVTVRSSQPGNGYGNSSGTSMAAPHVVGCAALMLSYDPTLSLDDIENSMRDTAVDLGAVGPDTVYGYGRIDCYEAIASLSDARAITSGDDSQTGLWGEVITYTVTLTNTGIVSDSYDIALGTSNWTTDLQAASTGQLEPGENFDVEVYVTIGEESSDMVAVMFTSTFDPNVMRVVNLSSHREFRTHLPIIHNDD